MSSKYRIIPLGGGITPEGTLNIRSEGVFDVTDYASVDVDIFDDTTTKTITNNGTYNASDDNVLGYSQVTVDVPASAVDSGTLTIEPITQNVTLFTQDVTGYRAIAFEVAVPNGTETITITNNGTYTPTSPNIGFSEVTVNVPVPSGYVNLTQNRAYNVSSVAVAFVNVPASEVDTGTKQITTNGNGQDVVGYAAVDVNVPNGTETIQITQNGTYTPTSPNIGFSSVEVSVGGQTEPDYFAVTALTDGSIQLIRAYQSSAPFPTLYISTDKQNWQTYDGSSISIQRDSTVYLYGQNERISSSSQNYFSFKFTGRVKLSGNIQTLLSKNGDISYVLPYCFYKLFGHDNISSFNETVIDVSDLRLTASALGDYAYGCMFYDCRKLVNHPVMNAMLLGQYCYSEMFSNCSTLQQAPSLPATFLKDGCYAHMFYNCSALQQAPSLPATTLTMYCYYNMFCKCTSLQQAPSLPAPSLAYYCYNGMFSDCSSLNRVEVYATSWNNNSAGSWLSGVAATGDFYNLGGATITTSSTSGIPSGWTEHTSL